MRRTLLWSWVGLLALTLSVVSVEADETFVSAAGGSVTIRNGDETDVELASQTIRLYLRPDGYVADISFVFRNTGPAVRHQVGFPRFSVGVDRDAGFRDFRTWVDDRPVSTVEVPQSDGEIRAWYVKNVEFLGYGTTATRVRYSAAYGRNRLLHTVEYLYGTGGSWSGPIGSLSLHVYNHECMWVDSYEIDEHPDSVVVSIGESDFEVHAVALEPGWTDRIRLGVEPTPWWLRTVQSETDEWFYSGTLLKQEYLRLLTLHQLAILRNTFYARRGLDFGDGYYGTFFRGFRWYRPEVRSAEGLLTVTELRNVQIIQAEEERRRSVLLEQQAHR